MMDELTRFGAAELARRIRVGDTSPLEVVDAPALHSVVLNGSFYAMAFCTSSGR